MDAAQIRRLVLRAIDDRGIAPGALVGETVLVRDGFYIGRRFVFEGLEAVWLLDSEQIIIRSDVDGMLAPIELSAPKGERPAA